LLCCGQCTVVGCCRQKARLRKGEAAFLAELDRSALASIALPPAAAKALVAR